MRPEEPMDGRTPQGGERPSPLGRQLVWIGVVVAVLAGVILWVRSRPAETPTEQNALNPNQVEVAKAAAEAIDLKTAKVAMEPAETTVQANGVVHFSPYSTINVSPRLTGKVSAVYVKVGDHVTTGEPIAQMVSPDAATAVDAERDALQQVTLTSTLLDAAKRQFALGTPEVQPAEATLVQAQENTKFEKKMLNLTLEQNSIGGFTDKPLTDAQSAFKQTQTQLEQDRKDLSLFQSQYDREVKLFGYGIAAKADVETADDALGKQKAAVSNDEEQLRIARVTLDREQKAYSTRLYANQTVRQAETNYQQAVIQENSAATAVRMAKAALVHDLKQAEHDYQAARADYHAAETVLSTYDNPSPEGMLLIKSPSDGVITARNINPGQLVDQTGETPWQMFTIVSAKTVYLDTQVYEKDMVGIHIGERVTATSDALPKGMVASGVISYVSPGLDPNTHALSVRADMDNSTGLLKDGMYLNAVVTVPPHSGFEPKPLVPLTAVVRDGNYDYVFLTAGEGKYQKHQVTLGEQRGEDQVVIAKGLTGSETIVTHGALYLGTGATQD